MATIRVTWKRSVRVREYETETLELMVEKDVPDAPDAGLVAYAVDWDRELAEAGDALVIERLGARVDSAPRQSPPRGQGKAQRSSAPPQAPDADPLV